MKAVGLLSGGLDSLLAVKLVKEQGIDVVALMFSGQFSKQKDIEKLEKMLGVKIVVMNLGDEYIRMLKKPKHGYGKGINPCIDCKIYMLKKAKQYAKKIGAKFIFTGEVVGQRPMSQHKQTLMLIEKEAGLAGKIVRPLSAGLLPETEAEKKGWINRKKLLDIEGRTRKTQLDYAKKFKLKDFTYGDSGCKLTDKIYARKLKDLFDNKKTVSINDIFLISYGRQFRLGKNLIIVGRNHEENENILKLKKKADIIFEVKDIGSPITLLRGKPDKVSIKLAAQLTARYSDAKEDNVEVSYGRKKIKVKKIKDPEKFRV